MSYRINLREAPLATNVYDIEFKVANASADFVKEIENLAKDIEKDTMLIASNKQILYWQECLNHLKNGILALPNGDYVFRNHELDFYYLNKEMVDRLNGIATKFRMTSFNWRRSGDKWS